MRNFSPFQILFITLPLAVSLVIISLILTLFAAENFIDGGQTVSQIDLSLPAWLLLIPSVLLSLVLYLFTRSNSAATASLGWLCLFSLTGGIVPVVWLYSDVSQLQELPTFAIYSIPVVYTFGMILGLFLAWSLLWIVAHFDERL